MQYTNGGGADQVLEAHEERLLRLESNVQKLVAQSTESLVRVEYIGKEVKETAARLEEKMDHTLEAMAAGFEKVNVAAANREIRLAVLEAAAASRKAFWKKVLIPVAVVGSVISSKFGEQIWAWITR